MSEAHAKVLGVVITVAYALLGVVLDVWWFYHRPSLSYSLIFVSNLLPAIGLLLVAVLTARYQPSMRKHVLIVVMAAGLGLSLFIVINSTAARDRHFYVDRNVENYAFYLEQDSKLWPEFFHHFPSEVHKGCSYVSFFRGRLLDLTLFQLRCQLDPESVKTIVEEYTPLAVHTQSGYDIDSLPQVPYLVTRFRNKHNTGFAPLADHFKLAVLRVGIDGCGNPHAWQTNYACGIALSTETNEVIYWATHPG